MSEQLKKVASSLGLRSKPSKGQRIVTPPSTTQPLEPEVTPPGQIIDTAADITPSEPLTVTPSAALIVDPPAIKSAKSPASAFGSARFRKKPAAAELEPRIYGQGVTGADDSLPVFDGTSSDPHDYLIDLDTDAMEGYPDVRSYFHYIGDMAQDATNPPLDMEQRRLYDNDLVRKGREYLKAARGRGHGLYLSNTRNFLTYNDPEGPWYRMPIAGVVNAFLKRDLVPMEDEGGFNLDPDEIAGVEPENVTKRGGLILTNIRSAIWWGDSLRPGIIPGTKGWDSAIYSLYWTDGHSSSIMWAGYGGRTGARSAIIRPLQLFDGNLFQEDKAGAIVASQWYRKEDDSDYSDDEEDSSPNRLVFDPSFLAEIAPDKPQGFFDRFK